MKRLAIILLLMTGVAMADNKVIKPKVAQSFGEVVTVEVEFIEKENSFIEQNLIKEPWLAKVISVNGAILKDPVVIEYVLVEGIEVKKGQTRKFMAYEDIYKLGAPRGWNEEVAKIDYHICHRLFLKPPRNKPKK